MADWHRRYRLAVAFLGTMAVLVAASEWYLPHWIPRFWQAIRNYQRYTGAKSVMDNLSGAPWSWVFELLAFIALIGVCWRERRHAANADIFNFTVGLALTTTILIVPSSSNYNQVFMIPALLVLAKDRRAIWRRSTINRSLLVMTVVLAAWPWVSSTALAVLSFALPRETVEQAWSMPFWTVIRFLWRWLP